MITYVNTVLVSNKEGAAVSKISDVAALKVTDKNQAATNKGDFVVYEIDPETVKIGLKLGTATKVKDSFYQDVRWSNEIKKSDIRDFSSNDVAKASEKSEDVIEIDFDKMDQYTKNVLEVGGKVVFLRLTFKDLPTRYRNWTETYDYMTKENDGAAEIAAAFADIVTRQFKRARVEAEAAGTVLKLTAMPYDDDNSVDTINVADKVRFNVSLYYKDPSAAAFASSNRYPLSTNEDFIKKTSGIVYPGEGKIVRDRESQAMGYLGILNRGNGTWPIIKPAMETDINKDYYTVTVEFENMYRAADDIFRKTKQTVEIYSLADVSADIKSALGIA